MDKPLDRTERGARPGRFGAADDQVRPHGEGPTGALLVRPDTIAAGRRPDRPPDPSDVLDAARTRPAGALTVAVA